MPLSPFASAAEGRRRASPAMGRGFDRLVERLFDVTAEQVQTEAVEIERSLSWSGVMTPGALRSNAIASEDIARRAFRLQAVATVEFERFEREVDSVIGAMRDAATNKLEDERRAKIRTKNITESDVREYAALMYPDQWADACDRRAQARELLDYLRSLAKLCKSHSFTLSNALSAREL